MPNILVIDDELSIRESFSLILEEKYKVLLAASGEVALKQVADQKLDLAFLDIRMPGMDGLETLKRIKEINPDLEVVMVTALNDVSKANAAVKHGARDYVVKPFDVNHIIKLTEQILRKKAIIKHGSQAQKKAARLIPELIGQSDKITKVLKTIEKIKNYERVIILGEDGTEKETIAQMIHEKSNRSDFPFYTVYLSRNMSPQKIKGLFFGWGKGTSTIALEAKSGLFEQIKMGTIFINNLEALPAEILETISSGKFSRLGSEAKIPIEARLIAGAGLNLPEEKREFYEYFSEVTIKLPPLRERNSDLPLLINHLFEKYIIQYGKEVDVETRALEALANYSWPGNTFQLASIIERLILSCANNKITLEDLPLDILINLAGSPGSNFATTFEQEYIKKIFELNHKSKEKTAAFLEITPFLLEAKL